MAANPTPPKFAYWLLKIFCRAEYRDEVAGDLQEMYEWRLTSGKARSAKYRYYLDVISAIRFYRGGRFITFISQAMLFSFVRSAFRNFKRHLSFTTLNVLGLALSMAAALFILQYVSEEINYNNSSGADRIYRVSNDYYRFDKKVYESSMTFSGVGPAMERDLSKVTAYARLYSVSIRRGGVAILTRPDLPEINFKEQKLFFADPDYLDFFDLTLTHGLNQMESPNTMLLTSELAEKYFGNQENALGKTLKYDDGEISFEVLITGIFRKPEFELQVDADLFISYNTLEQTNSEDFSNDWGGNAFMTFVRLTEQADPRHIEQAMSDLTLRYKPGYTEKDEEGTYLRVNRYFLTKVTDIHLNSKLQNEIGSIGDKTTVNILQVIALFIVTIAWINFINLSTAKSVDRAREVGVRKVMGARRKELVVQFFIEAFLINMMAVGLALVLILAGQSFFNWFVDKNLSIQSVDMGAFGWSGAVIFLVGTGLSGGYPALVLSSHRAVNALKGKSRVDASLILRRGLIIFQLLFSSLLIMATLAIGDQLEFMKSRGLGFEMDKVLILRGPVISPGEESSKRAGIDQFKKQVLSISGVSRVGTTSVIPGQGILRGLAISRVKMSEADMKSIERVVVSNDFLSTMKVKFLAGKDFDNTMMGYSPIILNASAAKELGFQDPTTAIGQALYEFTREERRIVGVIEDYHQESLNREIDAMYFVRNEAIDAFYAIRLHSESVGNTLVQIEENFKSAFPGNPAEYYFLDQFYARQYQKDEVNRKVFSAFAFMAILVACLGLYGLTSFSVVQRTKEVGVRKVLGASVSRLFVLLSAEVFFLVFMGFAVAIPIAWLGIDSWLSEFAYRMTISPMLFVLPLLMISAVTLGATGSRILRVTLANPVKSLRYE